MNFKGNCKFFPLLLLAAVLPIHAQQTVACNTIDASLPEAPHAALMLSVASSSVEQTSQPLPASAPLRHAHRLAKYIEPDEQAVPLSARDKLELSVWEQLQPYSFGTQILAAGWEHMLNSNPKYGTDKAGFGERLGAATIRQGSQAIFSDGVMAAALRQDPRYYRKGSGKIVNRVFYAATRVLITRTDAGNEAPNYSQLIGYAGASALTMTYYPAVSATWSNTASGYATSLLGSALGNGLHEFLPDILRLALHRHPGSPPR